MGSVSPLRIKCITAVPELVVSNSKGVAQQPSVPLEIWSSDGADVRDKPAGSLKPVALELAKKAQERYTLKLTIKGTCIFPEPWPRTATCQLQGTVKGSTDKIITSEDWTVVLDPTSPPKRESREFEFSNLTVPSPFKEGIPPVPNSLAGDIKWKIVIPGGDPKNDLEQRNTTRVEFCWLYGPAPTGPSLIRTSLERTVVDFQGKYPIGLLRAVLPTRNQLQAQPDPKPDPDPALPAGPEGWWIQYCERWLWKSGLIYNTISGRSAFGMGYCGGSFDLEEFVLIMNITDPTAKRTLVNSFDVTAIAQLALMLAAHRQTNDLWATHWVCKAPFGYINPTIPLALGVEVNNPFYQGIDGPYAGKPLIPTKELTNVPECKARAWLEVDLEKPARVVDLSHRLGELADCGQRDRDEYAAVHMVAATKTDLADFRDDMLSNGGQCHSNTDNQFSVKQSGEVADPEPPIARVGVYDLLGVGTPRRGAKQASVVPIPPVMRGIITEMMARGKNPQWPQLGYNDASLRFSSLQSIIQDGPLKDNTSDTSVRVTMGATVIKYSVDDVSLTSTVKGKMVIRIHVFDQLHDAYEAMAFELSKCERELSSVIRPLYPALGHYSLRTPDSFLCVRGNIFIEVTLIGMVRPDDTGYQLLTDAIGGLDLYLSKHVVSRSQARRPGMQLVEEPPATMKPGKTFEVRLRDTELLDQRVYAHSSQASVVVPAGPGDDGYTQRFFVMEPEYPPESLKVTIAGAHADTLHPGFVSFKMEVMAP
ncbi:uncharacterized protein ACLA_060040 [Aspergillus clavatus NRRL 1]|uniref:Uncharacterized protein n=1 Tax=Aspergillus clavatus (strain ATCC 1007 / CBS 513.65 / DSM 816 / NCTC 3887 / NRRL 1 / QM 1276 / 107) TaxID=344612 RepID=A1C4J7_ASPCL|nr:uncharacterized protein ACLA_060040 [Aspergillus clavatus NRRL 1]EAW15337.1 hypothetical protein ACLA_060040 [Aspergillus clavatus NRRL 1]